MKIFFSHSSRDKPLVNSLRQHLPPFLDSWIDEHSLCWGDAFEPEIRAAIKKESDYVIVLLDKDALKSPWVQREISWARLQEKTLGRTFLLAILLPSLPVDQLPDELQQRLQIRLLDYETDSVKAVADKVCQELLHLLVNENQHSNTAHDRGAPSQRKIIYYAPTLKANPFYHEILDHLIEITTAAPVPIDVIVRKSVTNIDPHQSDEDLRLIHSYAGRDIENTVLIVVPSSPESYDDILNLPADLNVNLITLDMEINEADKRVNSCPFLKHTIIVDNEYGAQMAAEAVIEYWKSPACLNWKGFNFMICEGEFHNRGQFFSDHLAHLAAGAQLALSRLDTPKQLEFSKPVSARNHVKQVLSARHADLHNKSTVVFCANDNLALGAQAALSSLQLACSKDCDVKIVSFDASDTMRTLLKLGDPDLLASVDQMYYKYAQKAIKVANDIFDGRAITSRVTHIQPKMIRNEKLFS